MKRKVFLFAFLLLAVMAGRGQGFVGMELLSGTLGEFGYEYHPYTFDLKQGTITFENTHAFKLGVASLCFPLESEEWSIQWNVLTLKLYSSGPNIATGICLTGFVLRAEKGRFCPRFALDLFEAGSKGGEKKVIWRNSISGGFDFYLTDILKTTVSLGITAEGFTSLSPFVGASFCFEIF